MRYTATLALLLGLVACGGPLEPGAIDPTLKSYDDATLEAVS